MEADECEHIDVIDDICNDCGLIVNEGFEFSCNYSMNYTRTSASKPSIIDTMEGIPLNVIETAQKNIRTNIQNGKKIRNDSKNAFIVLYNAYLETNTNFNPQYLASKLGLNRKDVNWCLKVSSGTSLSKTNVSHENKYFPIVIISPISFIDSICDNNGLEKYCESIKTITRQILSQKDILYSSRPEYVSYAIVKKYTEYHDIPIKSFSKKNNISDNALKRSINDIDFFFSYLKCQ